MKKFYLLRHIDVNGNSGTGVVAEGVIFDNGLAAMTWLSEEPTVTTFVFPKSVKKLHGHNGATEVILEGKDDRFEPCQTRLRLERKAKKNEKAKKD